MAAEFPPSSMIAHLETMELHACVSHRFIYILSGVYIFKASMGIHYCYCYIKSIITLKSVLQMFYYTRPNENN